MNTGEETKMLRSLVRKRKEYKLCKQSFPWSAASNASKTVITPTFTERVTSRIEWLGSGNTDGEENVVWTLRNCCQLLHIQPI